MTSLIFRADIEGSTVTPAVPEELDKVKLLLEDTQQNPNDISKWDTLFDALDEQLDTQPKGTIDQLKSVITKSYQHLLTRFPNLSQYWKRWSKVEGKLKDAQASLDLLETALDKVPHSIELWNTYLNALVLTYKGEEEEEQIRFIRYRYEKAIKLVGLNFNSHSIWDTIIQFETKVDPQSLVLLKVYLRLIRYPLYEYAQYYKQFIEVSKHFELQDILPSQILTDYLHQYNQSDPQALSVIETEQIIEDYTVRIHTKTQTEVSNKWQFESTLTIHEFSLLYLNEINNERIHWIKYLDYEISQTDFTVRDSYEKLISLFEQCLVPNCLDGKLWLKYIAVLNKTTMSDEEKFGTIKEVYNRSINNFVPLVETHLRSFYVKFLVKYDKVELANEYLFDLVKLYRGSTQSKLYLKAQYVSVVKDLLDLYKQYLPTNEYYELMEKLVTDYFQEHESKAKPQQQQQQQPKTKTNESCDPDSAKSRIDSSYTSLLPQLLNDDAIAPLTIVYLQETLRRKDTSKIRRFFNKYYKHNVYTSSTSFWTFYVEFEGLVEYNIGNLNSLMYHIKNYTQLPKLVIDALIDLHYDILNANLEDVYRTNSAYVLISRDLEMDSSIAYNHSLRTRLANNNYLVKEIEDAKISKSKNPSISTNITKEDELVKSIKKYVGHAGIKVDARPDISNKIMNKGNWISLTESVDPPSFPQFKNVEKANASINYPV